MVKCVNKPLTAQLVIEDVVRLALKLPTAVLCNNLLLSNCAYNHNHLVRQPLMVLT